MRLDSSIAVAQCTQPPHRFMLSLHQHPEFLCEFDMLCTTKKPVRHHSGCGHATSIHLRVHPACASSFRCQTTALSRGSSFDRIGCLPTNRSRAGARLSCPGAAPTRLQTWEMLVSPFVVVLHPAPPVNARTASRLPCRFAVTLPRAPTQAPLPDSGI